MFGAYGSTIYIVIACLAAIFVGVLEGNGAVYAFNHLPAKWLCDYGEEPSAELSVRMLTRSTESGSMPCLTAFSTMG